jgi:tetratricopeptide (TPR) repeat protein
MQFKYSTAIIILILAVFALAENSLAQKNTIKVSGKTRSLTIVTEPNAVVWIDDLRRGKTDETGKLILPSVGMGARSLRVRAVGFSEKTQPILPTQNGEIRVNLVKTTDDVELAFQTAEMLRESGKGEDKKKAEELYRKALQLRPKFPQAHLGLARLLESTDMDEALEQVKLARKDRPIYPEASVVEGRIYNANYETENAIASFQRAIREAKGVQPEAHTGLGLIYKEQEKLEEAVAEFKLALAQWDDAELIVYQFLGDTYEKMGNFKEAVKVYEKVLQIAPNSEVAIEIRSIIDQIRKEASQQDQ